MQIAQQDALAASKLGKKPVRKGTGPAKGFAPQQQGEKYDTLYGVGDKMATSKRQYVLQKTFYCDICNLLIIDFLCYAILRSNKQNQL